MGLSCSGTEGCWNEKGSDWSLACLDGRDKGTPLVTDYELAQRHRYVTLHGRKPAPGVTSVNILDKPGLMWAASEIAARTAVERHDERVSLTQSHRTELVVKRKSVKTRNGEKVPAAHADPIDVWIDYCRGEFRRAWDAKADLGSRIHDHALAWSAGRDIDALADEQGHLDALEAFLVEQNPKFLYAERVVVHPNPEGRDDLEYGGRLDFIAEIGGKTLLCDYKTGKQGFLGDKALQAAAYANAKGLANYDEDGALADLTPLPQLDGCRTIYLDGDGTYTVVDPFERLTPEAAWRAFLDLRSALNYVRLVEKIEKDEV